MNQRFAFADTEYYRQPSRLMVECATCQPGFFGDVSGMTTCAQRQSQGPWTFDTWMWYFWEMTT